MEIAELVQALGNSVGRLTGVVEGLSNGVKLLRERTDRLERAQVPPHLMVVMREMGEKAGQAMNEQTAATIAMAADIANTPKEILPFCRRCYYAMKSPACITCRKEPLFNGTPCRFIASDPLTPDGLRRIVAESGHAAKSVMDFGSMHVEVTPDPALPDVTAAMRHFGEVAEKAMAEGNPKTRAEAEEVCISWGVNNPEELSNEDPDEAIGDHLESLKREEWPETLTLHGFVRIKVGENWSSGPLTQVLDELDEEYGSPDRSNTKPTPAMEAAERTFLDAVIAEYKPWACEQIYEEEVSVLEWVKEHQPDWLEEEKAT
jgi:hypothetical protein